MIGPFIHLEAHMFIKTFSKRVLFIYSYFTGSQFLYAGEIFRRSVKAVPLPSVLSTLI